MAEALKTNAALQTLDLDSNSIRAEGAAALAEALKTNEVLQYLYLESNSIGYEGAVELADALKTNAASKLRTLDLRSNSIRAEGAAAFSFAEARQIQVPREFFLSPPVKSQP